MAEPEIERMSDEELLKAARTSSSMVTRETRKLEAMVSEFRRRVAAAKTEPPLKGSTP